MNIILIGFMGAGKTTAGTALAEKLGFCFLDTDHLIEQQSGMKVRELFEHYGEEYFRSKETECLRDLLSKGGAHVISVGGGLPLREENHSLLKELGLVVFLSIRKNTVLDRLKGDKTRPLLKGADVEAKVDELLRYRNPIYSQAADLVVETDGKSIRTIVKEIEEKLNEIIGD